MFLISSPVFRIRLPFAYLIGDLARGPQKTLGREAPRLLEWFLGPPGPSRPAKIDDFWVPEEEVCMVILVRSWVNGALQNGHRIDPGPMKAEHTESWQLCPPHAAWRVPGRQDLTPHGRSLPWRADVAGPRRGY